MASPTLDAHLHLSTSSTLRFSSVIDFHPPASTDSSRLSLNQMQQFLHRLGFPLWLSTSLLVLGQIAGASPAPLALHPQNPHYFLFRGKPTVLITSCAHYG